MRSILLYAAFALASALQLTTGHAQINGTIQHDGITRNYVLYVPSTWSAGQNLPLVFVLHGTTQTGSIIMDVSGFNTHAETNGFFAVYPDGIGGSWNTGIVGASTAEDMGFIDALATAITVQYGIDPTRVYSCGFSAGGYMSHRLACESPRCFAAIASVSGTMMPAASANCSPSRPTSVMQIHGTADFVVAYGGGTISGLGAEEVLAQWRTFDNCPTTPSITQLPNTNTLDFSTVEQRIWSPCDQGTAAVLLKVNGGGHQWPGTSALLGGIGTINRDIDASELIAYFFTQFSCAGLPTAVPTSAQMPAARYDPITDQVLFTTTKAGATVQLIDAMGRVMYNARSGTGNQQLDLRAFSPGTYVLRIVSDTATSSRFVKE